MSAPKQRGLGRGLDAIFGTTSPAQQSKPMSEMAEVSISAIEPNPLQPRTSFDDEALGELSTSIAQLGVIQPITIKPNGNDKYIIISGERRWRAAKMAGLENIQRENLNAIEIALGMKRLVEECGLTQEAMAVKVGKKRSTVSNYMRLLSMPSEVQLALKEGIISMGHAKAIGGLELDLQLKALKKCIKKSLSVRQTEELARKMADTTPKGDSTEDEEYPESYSRLVMELERIISDNISIKRTKSGSSRITIECSNDTEVEQLISKLSKIK